MDKRLVALVERAVHSQLDVFPLNAGWRYLHREYNIGTPSGNRIRVSDRDKKELIELVEQVTGLDLRSGSVAAFADLSRSEALEQSRCEKWAGRAVAGHRLAVKALPGKPLRLNGKALHLPGRSHLDIFAGSVESFQHDAILVVENYQCFDRLELMKWALVEPFDNPLVIYRGDPNTSGADVCNGFLHVWKRPVLAMVDLDPAGLLIAQALPSAAGLVAPSLAVLDPLFQHGNPELYHRQRPAAERALLNSPYPKLRCFWRVIEQHRAGLVQERWLQGDVEMQVHLF